MEPDDDPVLPLRPTEVVDTVTLDTRPRAVSAWVAALPMTDPWASGWALLGRLEALQTARLGAGARHRLLEILRPAALACCAGLGDSVARQSSVPAERQAQRSDLVQRLHAHLALGYQRVCEGLLAGPRLWPSRKPLALALGRALDHRGAQLLGIYQRYIAPPPQLWLAIHRLYRIAESHRLERLPAADSEDARSAGASIAQCYQQLLLVAVADPYGLRPVELAQIFGQIPLWPDVVRLSNQADPVGAFVVNLDLDQPPLRRAQYVKPWTEHCRSLHTADLVTALQRRLAGTQPPGEREPSGTTLRHLIRVWGDAPARQHPRNERLLTLEVVLGLSATHQFIAPPNHPAPGPAEELPATSADAPAPAEPLPQALALRTGLWRVRSPAPVPASEPEPDLPSTPAPALDPGPISVVGGYASYARSATDVSIGGYRLLWRAPVPSGLLVGEVIGLRPYEPGAAHRPWAVGVVRWLRRGDDGSVTGGVQLLAPTATAVGCRPAGTDGSYLKGLLLSELRPIGQPATLLLPSIRGDSGQQMDVAGRGTRIRVELTELVSSSAGYRQFHFLPAD